MATRGLILALIWMLTPGLTETAENLWHVVRWGHAAHAADQGADHEPKGDEHGCSGTFHLCSCHHSTSATLTPAIAGTDLPALDRSLSALTSSAESPLLAGLFRPPRA